MKGVVKTKPSLPPEVNDSNNLTEKNEGQVPKSNNYRGKNTRDKSQVPDTKSNTNFKGRCSDLEDYIFGLGLRALGKFSRTMKEPEHCLGATYRNSCQPAIMTDTLGTLPDS